MNFENPRMVQLMSLMNEIKRDYLKGNITRTDVARQMNALLHYYGLVRPEAVVGPDEIPDAFFEPCDCIFCRADAGQSPIPVEGVVAVENIRLAFRLGVLTKLDAMAEIRKIFHRFNVIEDDAIKFWNMPVQSYDPHHTVIPVVTPLKPEEESFFKGLEEQLKNIPKEDK